MIPGSEFYREESTHLARMAKRKGVPRDQIDEVVQETWLDALEHQSRFRGDSLGELCSWLERIVQSKVIDAFRRLDRRRTESLSSLLAEAIVGRASDPASLVDAQEQREEGAKVLAKLRQEQPQDCCLLCEHILNERKLKELAQENGLSVNAVRNRISRARTQLRQKLFASLS